MARKRGEDEPSSYQPRSEVPAEIAQKHALVMEVLAGRKTISEAAEELGIARVNMQTMVHRAEWVRRCFSMERSGARGTADSRSASWPRHASSFSNWTLPER